MDKQNNNLRVLTLYSLKNTNMTILELLARMDQLRSFASLSGYEFYIDGDTETICAKVKA